MRRLALLAAAPVALLVLLGSLPAAHAYTPYHTVTYTSKAGNASANGVPTPQTDITQVGYAYNGKYLRFTMVTADVTRTAPPGYDGMDFAWRFSSNGTQYMAEYAHSTSEFLFNTDYVGTTTAGVDTTASCTQCYATINLQKKEIEFFVSIDQFNTFVSSATSTAPGVGPGAVLKLIEADTFVDPPGFSGTFQTDTAPAPKGLTFTV